MLNSQPFPKSVSKNLPYRFVLNPFSLATTPDLPILPASPFLAIYKCRAPSTNRPLPRKTNPISDIPKPLQTLFTQSLTPISRPTHRTKTNPISPTPRGPSVGDPLRDKTTPPRSSRYASRFTRYSSRFTRYEILDFSPPFCYLQGWLRPHNLTIWRLERCD